MIACAGDTAPAAPPPPHVAEIVLRHYTRAVLVSDRITSEAEAYDSNYNRLPTPVLDWSSDDPTIATVDQNGRVTGQGIGEAVIRASLGSVQSTLRIAVKAMKLVVLAHGAPDLVMGDSVMLEVRFIALDGTPIARHPVPTWATNDAAIVGLNPVALDPSFVTVTGRAKGLASISAGIDGMESVFIVGVMPEPVPQDDPVQIVDFRFTNYFGYWDYITAFAPTMRVTVDSDRAVTILRVDVALPIRKSKPLPSLCSIGRLFPGIHRVLSATSYPTQPFYSFGFASVSDADGAALLTYQTDDGRVTSRIVRGRVDQENYESEYETPIPWHVCES